MQLRKLPGRHLQRGVDARVVVRPDGTVDLCNEVAERREPIRIPEIDLELVVKALLVPVLPR